MMMKWVYMLTMMMTTMIHGEDKSSTAMLMMKWLLMFVPFICLQDH